MILPDKIINISNSLLGLGGIVIEELKQNYTISMLWENLREKSKFSSFETFIITLDFLFILGIIEWDGNTIKITHVGV